MGLAHRPDWLIPLNPDRPWVDLPAASHARSSQAHNVTELTWTVRQGWVSSESGVLAENQVAYFLGKEVEHVNLTGYAPILRLRIPADAPARHFVSMVNHAQSAGFERLLVAAYR
ncbi:hypothetical protein Hhel01_00068 [Haloferula helveola]